MRGTSSRSPMAAPEFIPGLDLAEALYAQVAPILSHHYPDLRWGAARWGRGSEVLGFDTVTSMDHDWGPRLQVYLHVDDAGLASELSSLLANELPLTCAGFPNNFASDGSSRVMSPGSHPLAHGVAIGTLERFLTRYVGSSLLPETLADWLTIPSQKLRGLTAGRILRDDNESLGPVTAHLAWYPDRVWRYLLLAGLQRIEQEAPFAPRALETGDRVGQQLVLARLTDDLVSLAFLIERSHRPYQKWTGRALSELALGEVLGPQLIEMHGAADPEQQLACWQRACLSVVRAFNRLGIAPPMPETFVPFHDRRYEVPAIAAIAALSEELSDEVATYGLAGAV